MNDTKFCTNCGCQVALDVEICPQCGVQLAPKERPLNTASIAGSSLTKNASSALTAASKWPT